MFTALCTELQGLKVEAETKLYAPLALYGEGATEETMADGDSQVHMARMLPLLQSLAMFVARVQRVVKNVVQQLGVVYAPTPAAHCIDTSDVHLTVCLLLHFFFWLFSRERE